MTVIDINGYTETMDKLYTIKETQELLKVSRAKVYLLIKDGSILPIKLGKRTLFPESELHRFIEELKDRK